MDLSQSGYGPIIDRCALCTPISYALTSLAWVVRFTLLRFGELGLSRHSIRDCAP